MTKTWIAVLAATLGLTAAPLSAAPPPEFKNLPSSEIKIAPLPVDTKIVLTSAQTAPTAVPAPAPLPATPAPAPAPAPTGPACGAACPVGNSCAPGCANKDLPLVNQFLEGCYGSQHPCLGRLWDWMTYRPCWTAPGCCYWRRPEPDNFTFFLYPGCVEGSCARGCAGCGHPAGPCLGNSCGH